MAWNDDTPARHREAVMTRRTMLRRTGLGIATIAVLGTGAVGYRAHDQGLLEAGEGPAYAPWTTWRHGDGLLRLVHAAVLAPSPHNAQAWLFSLAADHIDVHADRSRRTGAIDPFDRELHIGIGAALENLALAARAEGWNPTVELLPADDSSHLARVALARSRARVSPLYQQIPNRRTNRFPYVLGRPVEQEALDAMSALALPGCRVIWITDLGGRRQLGELLVTATRAIVADAAQLESDHRWFRHSWDEIQRRRDGITLDAAGLPALTTAVAKLLPAQNPSRLGEAWLDATASRHTPTAAAYGLIAVDEPADIAARIRCGRTLQRIHLWATGAGLGLHHMNQISERADRELQLDAPGPFGAALADLSPSGTRVLCSFRLGHPTRHPGPSPRRAAEQVVRG
jgi:hypothetical protein